MFCWVNLPNTSIKEQRFFFSQEEALRKHILPQRTTKRPCTEYFCLFSLLIHHIFCSEPCKSWTALTCTLIHEDPDFTTWAMTLALAGSLSYEETLLRSALWRGGIISGTHCLAIRQVWERPQKQPALQGFHRTLYLKLTHGKPAFSWCLNVFYLWINKRKFTWTPFLPPIPPFLSIH